MKTSKPNVNKDNYLAWLLSGLFGVLSGVFLAWGYQLEKYDRIDLSDSNANLVMLMLMVVITVDVKHVWNNYNDTKRGAKLFGLFKLDHEKKLQTGEFGKKAFLRTWGVLILLNLPVLLAEYPGFFVYDAQDELNEVLTRSFSTHHPLLHVLILGGVIALVHKVTGSWNLGIFAYSVFQMLVITAIFAYVLGFMSKRGVGKKGRIVWTLYYGLFPTIVMFTLCSSKDGLFSAMVLLLTVMLLQLVSDTKAFCGDKRKVAAFILVATLMPCFRHNGFYAYLVFVPFALIYFRKKQKPVLVGILVLPVVCYLIISSVLSASFSSEITHHQEMLTVPIMQLARVYTYEKDSLTKEEMDTLTSYIPEENLKLYSPRVSDLVKVGFNNELYEQDSRSFWKLWISQLKKHPFLYVNAWALTSYGYLYPAAKINVYKGTTVYTFTYDESSYFGYEVEPPGERHSFIPAIDNLYRYLSIGSFFEDAPVAGLPFEPGLLILIYLFVLFYRLSVRNIKGVLPFLPLLLTWMTVLLGPTYLVRYVLYLWTCLPLLFDKGYQV
ncbi:MAG: hypothetical protein II842_10120 [Butyrivibrio sp.]|nr:hypothetical protein [Butyrivibrio sp.]